MSLARGVGGLLACRRLRIGDAAFDHAVALGDDLPVPAAVSAGHDPKFDIWLHGVHDRLPHSVSPPPQLDYRLRRTPHKERHEAPTASDRRNFGLHRLSALSARFYGGHSSRPLS